MKTLKLSRGQINKVWNLLDVPLHGEEIRQRNTFIKAINPIVDKVEETRKAILSKHSNKNEDGTVKFVNGLYDIPQENREASLKDLTEDLATMEELELDKATIGAVKSILSKSTKELKIEEGAVYDAILTALENA